MRDVIDRLLFGINAAVRGAFLSDPLGVVGIIMVLLRSRQHESVFYVTGI